MHQASAVWVGVCSSPGRRLTFSENPAKILGESRARRKILGVICRKFWDFRASFAGALITPRERCHVTQPRARVNVSCSRAGDRDDDDDIYLRPASSEWLTTL